MLQFFIDSSYHSIFSKGYTPKLEYICNVGPDSSTMPRSMHEHKDLIEILLVYGGVGIYIIDSKRYTAKKGDLILYNSCTVHDENGGSGSDLCTYCVAISGMKLEQLGQINKILPDSYSPIINCGDYFDEMFQMCQLIERESLRPQGAETATYLAMAFVTKVWSLLKSHGLPRKKQNLSLSNQARSYIDAHYKEDLHLEDIAKAIYTNVYNLSRIFKSDIGISPMKYVILRRIGEAQNLLINTDMKITQIAMNVGYNNSNYFQNAFKDVMNMTPKEYRKKWTK